MKTKDEEQLEHAARLLRVLGHPVRLAMVGELKSRQWCVCELASQLGLNKSAASKHLSLLKSVGVVEMEKEGTRVNCSLMMPCVTEMLNCMNACSSGPVTTADSLSTACCGTQNKEILQDE